jgi:hypothetical protein
MKVTRLISSTTVLAVLFVLVAHTTAAAQQAHGVAGVTVPARSSGVSSPSTLPGPRLQPEWRSVQPAFADSSPSSPPVSSTQTITVTTLVLVLVVIILVLLIAK